MQPKVRSPIVVLMIIMAVVLGVGGFAIVSLMFNRPSTPEGTAPVTVNGVEILVALDQEKTVAIVGPSEVVQQPLPQAPLPEATAVTDEQPAATPIPTEAPLPTPTFVPPSPTPVPEKVILIDYLVQANDSLYQVANRLDTSIALMAQYGISTDDLTPGNTISLPVGNPAYCPNRRPYAVMEGDTAYSIAQRVGISAADLQAINNLDANFTVRVADILCVP